MLRTVPSNVPREDASLATECHTRKTNYALAAMAEPKSEEGPRLCWRRDQDTKEAGRARRAPSPARQWHRLRDIRRRAREREMVELLAPRETVCPGTSSRVAVLICRSCFGRKSDERKPPRNTSERKGRRQTACRGRAVALAVVASSREAEEGCARRDSLQRTDGDPFKVGERSF